MIVKGRAIERIIVMSRIIVCFTEKVFRFTGMVSFESNTEGY